MQTERQKEIVLAALELINSKGIQGLTIKNIAQKIGVTEPAIYRHYENKIQILLSILDLFKDNTERFFQDELRNKKGATAKIQHLFNCHITAFTKSPSFVSVIFSEELFKNEEILMLKINEVIDKNNAILIEIISKGQIEEEIRRDISATHLAIVVMGTLRLFVKKWQFASTHFDLKAEGEKMVASLLLLITKNNN
ncbi:MAG TPA: hypothetical protein DCG69_06300 [Bacteroidales bacterium]|nr:hypothetical protein [Bacteroidales bacterium]